MLQVACIVCEGTGITNRIMYNPQNKKLPLFWLNPTDFVNSSKIKYLTVISLLYRM